MKLKYRLPLLFSLAFSILLAAVMLTVYYLFAKFRREEFKDRISERGQTVGKLFLEVKEVDSSMLRIIDKNSVHKLYHEKTFLFNEAMELMYSSSDTVIHWSRAELDDFRRHREVFKSKGSYEVLGLAYRYENRDYYLLIYAEDRYGLRKLNYLKFLLLGAFVFGTTLVWLLSFYISKKTLKPLEKVREQVQDITSKNLTVRVFEPVRNDEIKALSQSFNQMINRIDKAYKSQRDFTSNASHELRTPVTRIVMQLENLTKLKDVDPALKASLASISDDAYQLSELITSLLLFSDIDVNDRNAWFQALRVDELIFYCARQIHKINSDFTFHFEIENNTEREVCMDVLGDEALLRIVFLNLFRNAYNYSEDQSVDCILKQEDKTLQLLIINTGELPDVADTNRLFEIFSRGSNSKHRAGNGIGLSIVRRILDGHCATIQYNTYQPNINEIRIDFPLNL